MANKLTTLIRENIAAFSIFTCSLFLFATLVGVSTFIINRNNLNSTPVTAANGDLNWIAFDGGGSSQGYNSSESTITTGNVGNLTKLWSASLPAVADNSIVEQANVNTTSGTKDLVFINTIKGNL